MPNFSIFISRNQEDVHELSTWCNSQNLVINSKSLELTNIPNPFTGKTLIKFNVKDQSSMDIKIRDVLGKTVFTDNIKTKFGENAYEFDGSKLNTGIYFYTISYKNYSETKRMIIASN